MRTLLAGLACSAAILSGAVPAAAQEAGLPPIMIQRQGAFEAGGRVLGDPQASSLSCDHGYVEYDIPVDARPVSLFLWHSSSAAVWQTRWDGGEGFRSIFLRRGFPVYLWDGPRVGRANWGCADYLYRAEEGRDQSSFLAWRLGASYMDWFDGVQFPTQDPEAWNQAVRARYQEFDTVANAQLETDAAAAALERAGPSVLVTNSAGGFRALLTALKSDNVRAIVAYESPGYVFPEGEGPQLDEGPFGPVYVPAEQFERLTRFPIQIVWGDNVDKSESWRKMRELSLQFAEIANAHGGDVQVLDLPAAGLTGNTHIPFADLNNVAVADLLSAFLEEKNIGTR